MIVILDYENKDLNRLKLLLDKTHYEYKFSLLEKDIIRANKLILPDPIDIKNSYRKLNLMNLTNVLEW